LAALTASEESFLLSTRVQLAGRIGGIGRPVSTDGKTIARNVGIGQQLKITTVLFIHCRGNNFFLEVYFVGRIKPKNFTVFSSYIKNKLSKRQDPGCFKANLKAYVVCHIYASYLWTFDLYGPVPVYIMLLMQANPLRGQVGRSWALEIKTFLGPVKWHRAVRQVPFGAQKSRDFQGPTPLPLPQVMDLPASQALINQMSTGSFLYMSFQGP
jgi:hypothetical protein